MTIHNCGVQQIRFSSGITASSATWDGEAREGGDGDGDRACAFIDLGSPEVGLPFPYLVSESEDDGHRDRCIQCHPYLGPFWGRGSER